MPEFLESSWAILGIDHGRGGDVWRPTGVGAQIDESRWRVGAGIDHRYPLPGFAGGDVIDGESEPVRGPAWGGGRTSRGQLKDDVTSDAIEHGDVNDAVMFAAEGDAAPIERDRCGLVVAWSADCEWKGGVGSPADAKEHRRAVITADGGDDAASCRVKGWINAPAGKGEHMTKGFLVGRWWRRSSKSGQYT